jgi:hypothetical protein
MSCYYSNRIKENKMEIVLGLLLVVSFLAFVIVVASVLNGFTLTVLWDWFIVPTFHLASLTIPQAIGLGMVISFLTYSANSKDGEVDWKVSLARYPIILGIGYIIQLFI